MNATHSTYRSTKVQDRTAVQEGELLTVLQGGEIVAEHRVAGMTPGEIWALVNAPMVAEEYEVDVPGVFATHMEESSIGTGDDDADADSKATRLALEAGKEVRVGSRYVLRITASKAVMGVLRVYAETIMSGGEWHRTEIASAERMIYALTNAQPVARPAEGETVEWRKDLRSSTYQVLEINGKGLGYVVEAGGRWQGHRFAGIGRAPMVTWAQTEDGAKSRLIAKLS